MTDLWAYAPALVGQTLQTATGREFDIVHVGTNHLMIRVSSTGNERRVSQREIEATDALWPSSNLPPRPDEIRAAQASETNPAYMVPLVRALRGLRQKA